jgi:hypothetical protein
LASGRFLIWTAVSCALGVGLATWLADDSSHAVRAMAALFGLGVGLLVVFLVAWALPPAEPQTGEPRAPVTPIAHEPVVFPPSASVAASAPPAPPPELADRLAEGRALAASGAETHAVDAWIDATSASLARHRPGVRGYFDALGNRAFADEEARLAAHLRRLETIVVEMT